jgi:hypothetical protein
LYASFTAISRQPSVQRAILTLCATPCVSEGPGAATITAPQSAFGFKIRPLSPAENASNGFLQMHVPDERNYVLVPEPRLLLRLLCRTFR